MRRILACASVFVLVPAAVGIAGIRDDGKDVICTQGKRESLRYRHGGELIKPYAVELCTPAGINVLRDSPSDHKHHHGLMFAVAVDGVNFWEEFDPFGREVGRDLALLTPDDESKTTSRPADACCGLRQRIDWMGPAGAEPLLEETRVLQVHGSAEANATLLTWMSRLGVPAGKTSAKVTGSPYFGLGMRFVESMDENGRFLNADGKTGVKQTRLVRSAWCAYSAQAAGKPVTVVMFDHPDNLRHPATWFTMEKPFAYLAVTLNLKNEPITIEAGKPLQLRYGVAVWDGTVTKEEIEALYRKWLARASLDGPVRSTMQQTR